LARGGNKRTSSCGRQKKDREGHSEVICHSTSKHAKGKSGRSRDGKKRSQGKKGKNHEGTGTKKKDETERCRLQSRAGGRIKLPGTGKRAAVSRAT